MEHSLNTSFNPGLILICGNPGTGKTYSLKNIRNPNRWKYINCETGKTLPFKFKDKENKFVEVKINNADQVLEELRNTVINKDSFDGIIIDSITFLMEMYTSQKIVGSRDPRKGWQDYGEFARTLLQQVPLVWGKPLIFLAHIVDEIDEELNVKGTKVPLKGQVGSKGIEAYFNSVIYARKINTNKLNNYKENNNLLHITQKEIDLNRKWVFQTQVTKETIGDRIRNPEDCFSDAETYIDNDIQLVLDRLNEYYSE